MTYISLHVETVNRRSKKSALPTQHATFDQLKSMLINNGILFGPSCDDDENSLVSLRKKLLHDQIEIVEATASSSESDAALIERINKDMQLCESKMSSSSEIFPPLEIDDQSRVQELIRARKTDIPDEDKAHFSSILRKPPTHEVVILKYKIDMTYSKIQVLKPGAWLNDEVINFYMSMLQERDSQLSAGVGGRRTSHYFNSFFMSKLLERDQYTYSNVRRWSKTFDVFSKDKIFIPVNIHNTHWTMAVVFIVKKEVHYYDSMSGSGRKYLLALQQWLKDEAKDKKGVEDLDTSDWKLLDREPGVPQQSNGYDCGVFSIMCADYLSDDLPIGSYSQSEMPSCRVKIGCSILRGSIPY